MKLKLFIATVATGLVAAAFGGSAVLAADQQPGQQAPAKHRGFVFVFRGELLATPSSTSTSLSVRVKGGNKPALKKMLGASTDQNFAVGDQTIYIRWANGVPSVVQKTNLVVGDRVSIRIRAPRHSSLAEIEATPARAVSARAATAAHPRQPLFLFRGTLSAPAADGKLTVHVLGGNRRALRKLLGQSQDQTFSYDANTVFLVWNGGIPSVVSPSQLTVGAKIVVRIRAARGSTLAQIEGTPARIVAQHQAASKG